MIKEIYSVKEYNDILNEYVKYHNDRYSASKQEIEDKYCIAGISFKITTKEQYLDKEIREIFGSNVCILDDTLPLLGRYCKTKDGDGEGTFVGIEITEEDFYYMLQHADGTIYESCVGSIEDKFPGIDYESGEYNG